MNLNRLLREFIISIFLLMLSTVFLSSCVKSDEGTAPSNSGVTSPENNGSKPDTTSLSIHPVTVLLAVNNTYSFSVSGGDGSYTYSILSGEGSIDSVSGQFTAGASSGAVVVRVTDGSGLQSEAQITVNSALQISPTSQTMAFNSVQNFSASGGVPPYTYSVVSGAGTVASETGQFTSANAAGSTVIQVTDALLNVAQANINVNSAPTINSLIALTVYEGRPAVIQLALTDADGALSCTSAHLSASSSNSALIPVSNIVFSGVYPNCLATLTLAAGQNGTSDISIAVTDSLATSTASFVLTGQKINSVALSPLTPIVPKNSNFSFTLTATYSDASTKNITANSSWATSNAAISSFTSAGVLHNTYAGVSVATSTITATYGAFTANTLATINPATITSLIVNTTSATMNVNNTIQVKCYGLTSDGGSLDLTQSCQWSSANSLVVSVDNSVDKGLVTAVSLGSATLVTATYGAFSATSSISVDVTEPVTSDNGLGLTARYYSGTTLTNLVNTRVDTNVNFNWAQANNPAGNVDSFSVRWTGFIKAPVSGTYTFYTQSDDGTRLWVNGAQIVNNWTDHPVVENSGTITLVAGQKYPITLEFYENGGYAVMQLSYSAPGVSKQIIPQIQLFPY